MVKFIFLILFICFNSAEESREDHNLQNVDNLQLTGLTSYYSANVERLEHIKQKYDPDNFFRF